DDVLGFGSVNAIMSGVRAGMAIADNLDYSLVMRRFTKDIKAKHELRKAIDTFSNDDFDKVISFLTAPVIKQLIYKNPFYKITQTILPAKAYNRIKRGSLR
ncbi:MAG: dehydrogenase, partial [Candidatus Saccharibacteria bacterium]